MLYLRAWRIPERSWSGSSVREVELKSVVPDVEAARARIEDAGGQLTYEGSLIDLRYGDAGGRLVLADEVLRLRVYLREGIREGYIDWKGPTRYEEGYKVREELSSTVGDPESLRQILGNLGFIVIREIEREIAQYSLLGAVVRFEIYPRMDSLVEVEGPPTAIESAIATLGLPREGFTAERLPAFVSRFEMRTGERAALSEAELRGEYQFRRDD